MEIDFLDTTPTENHILSITTSLRKETFPGRIHIFAGNHFSGKTKTLKKIYEVTQTNWFKLKHHKPGVFFFDGYSRFLKNINVEKLIEELQSDDRKFNLILIDNIELGLDIKE